MVFYVRRNGYGRTYLGSAALGGYNVMKYPSGMPDCFYFWNTSGYWWMK